MEGHSGLEPFSSFNTSYSRILDFRAIFNGSGVNDTNVTL
ncbi:MAG: hypothetical protein HW405_809 [Candidatus Berkelbacteria bacterium]|nr:hypothetical protein [Candidatus Berkelbacteria bacterium]